MAISNLNNSELGLLDTFDYVELFSIGKNEIGFIDGNNRVQNENVVAQLLRKLNTIKYFYIDEEKEIILLVFEEQKDIGKIGIKLFGAETLDRFFGLLKKEPDLYVKFSSQIKKINKQQEKESLKETTRRVKRENKHTSNKATIGLSIAASIVIATGAIGYLTRNRDTTQSIERPQESSTYELPTTTTTETTAVDETTVSEPTNTSYFTDISYSSFEYNSSAPEYNTSTIEKQVEKRCIEVCYEDRQYDSKATICKENYYDLIKKYSNMYGIDSKIMLAIATHERGTHSNVPDDSGAIGLMQLELDVWAKNDPEAELRAYNYETGESDVYNLPLPDMGDLENNVRYACMYFQNCMKYMHNNPIAAIQCYNYGPTTTKNVIDKYCVSTGMTRDEVLADIYNTEWLEFRCYESTGDPEYVENVLSYLGIENDFTMMDSNKNTIEFSIKGKQHVRTLS